MDVQKVIEIISSFRFGTEENEACEMAVQLLEKQVPKKPEISEATRQRLFSDGEHEGYTDWQEKCYVCPICNSFLSYVTECDEEEYQCDYCSNCGQAIEWGKDESNSEE